MSDNNTTKFVFELGNENVFGAMQSRVVIDGVTYSDTGSIRSSSNRQLSTSFGNIGVVLSAGQHLISLQWKADGIDWQTIGKVSGGFTKDVELMTIITSENQAPTITTPFQQLSGNGSKSAIYAISSFEHNVLHLEGIKVDDVDEDLSVAYYCVLQLVCQKGKLSFASIPYAMRDYLYEDEGAGSILIMNDTLTNINEALADVIYSPQFDFYGNDTLSITLMDDANFGYGGTQITTADLLISIIDVDEPFYFNIPEPFTPLEFY